MKRAILYPTVAALVAMSQLGCRDTPTEPGKDPSVNSRPHVGRTLNTSTAAGVSIYLVDLGYGFGNAINDAATIAGHLGLYTDEEVARIWYADGSTHGFQVDCPPPCWPYPAPGCDPLADPGCQPAVSAPSNAFGLNDAGKVVGYYSYVERPAYYMYDDAFVWSEGAQYAVSPFRHHHGTRLYAVNDAGQSVGSYQFDRPGEGPHAVVFDVNGLHDLGAPVGTKSVAYDVNAFGDAVGQSPGPDDVASGEAILWPRSGAPVRLGLIGGNYFSAARAINDAGVVVGWMRGAIFNKVPFRWTAEQGMEVLPTLGNGGTAEGINKDGYIVGTIYLQSYSNVGHAALWTPEGEMVDLGTLAGGRSDATDINSHLQVSGSATDAGGQSHVVRWDVSIATNHAPMADAHGPYTGAEGSPIVFSGTASDQDGDIHDIVWQFGDGSSATGSSSRHTYQDNGTYTATLTVTDSHGLTASSTATVSVTNVAPTVRLTAPSSIISGQSIDLTTTFADPGIRDMPWQYRIEWDIGAPTTGSTRSQESAFTSQSPRYCTSGEYSVRATLTDKDNGSGDATTVLHVRPIDIPIVALTETINSRSQGKLPVVVLSSADFDAREVNVASVALGDAEGHLAQVARQPRGRPLASIEDVNHDGRPDLILHFEGADLAALGVLSAPVTKLWLTGQLLDGCREISGVTDVRVIDPAGKAR